MLAWWQRYLEAETRVDVAAIRMLEKNVFFWFSAGAISFNVHLGAVNALSGDNGQKEHNGDLVIDRGQMFHSFGNPA